MSSLFDRKKIVPRYKTISYLMLLLGLLIVSKALYTATVKRDYWVKVADRLKRDSVDVKPVRGNILSSDGQLMASSIPEFKLYMDFKAGGEVKDSMWTRAADRIHRQPRVLRRGRALLRGCGRYTVYLLYLGG